MIERVHIANFRCFKELDISDLRKINLIVGENSSGKSAFLESIFLSFQMRGIRRMGGQFVVPTDAQGYRGLWEDLFYDFVENKRVSVKAGMKVGQCNGVKLGQ